MADKPSFVRLITWLPVGGIERRLVSVVPRLIARGWRGRVVCIREEGPLAEELRAQGVPVDVIPFTSRLSPKGLRQLAAYLKEHRIDVLHAHMYRSNVPGTIAARMAGTPVMFGQIHNVDTWESSRQLMMDRFLSRWRTGVFCVSERVRQDVIRNLRLPEEKALLLYNGVDIDQFRPDGEARRRIREEFGVPEDAVVSLVPARLHPQKNPLGMLEAFSRAGKGISPPPQLWFAGEGKLRGELEAEIERKGLGGQVRLLGKRDDMGALYNAADLMVLSSFKEGFSNAVVEALSTGKPVLASDVGGNAEAINSRDTGWIHPPGDVESFAAQWKEALGLGVEGLAEYETTCRERASRFSVETLVDETDRYYRRALEGGHLE